MGKAVGQAEAGPHADSNIIRFKGRDVAQGIAANITRVDRYCVYTLFSDHFSGSQLDGIE